MMVMTCTFIDFIPCTSRLSAKFLVSGSEDQTIKLWKVPAEVKKDSGYLVTLQSSATQWAHEDDINFVAVAPNDQFLASASKDKTAKVSVSSALQGQDSQGECIQCTPRSRQPR